MTRQRRRAMKVLAALSLPAILSGAACLRVEGDAAEMGRVELTLPSGASIVTVGWRILSGEAGVLASGSVDTHDPHATPSVIAGVPPGRGYTVELTATTSAGLDCSGASAAFDVVAGQVAPVTVTLVCASTTPDSGVSSVVINGTVVEGDSCPILVAWQISPRQTSASGGQIEVAVSASDADPGDTLTIAWSATAGSLVNPAALSTQYVCGTPGSQTLTVTISDNHRPIPCSTNVTFPAIDCL